MKKAKCIKGIGNFKQGETYSIIENTTTCFKILSPLDEIKTFSKLYDTEYPNFRAYFEIK